MTRLRNLSQQNFGASVLKLQEPDDKILERWFRIFRHSGRQDLGAVVLKIVRKPRYLIADKRRKKIRKRSLSIAAR